MTTVRTKPIRIVPDFEPEIENSITEALSTIAASQEEDTDGNAQNTSTGMIVSGTEVPAKKADPVRIHDEDALDRRDRSRMIGFVLTVVIVFMIAIVESASVILFSISGSKSGTIRISLPQASQIR